MSGISLRITMINHWMMQSNAGNIKKALRVTTNMKKVIWRYYEKSKNYSNEKSQARRFN